MAEEPALEDSSPEVRPPNSTSQFEVEYDGEEPAKQPRLDEQQFDSPVIVIRHDKPGEDDGNGVQSSAETAFVDEGGGEESTEEGNNKAQIAAEVAEQKGDAQVHVSQRIEIPPVNKDDVGASKSLVPGRGFAVAITAESIEIDIPVPDDKVRLLMGNGGEMVRNLQTRSGACIQMHGDLPKEKKVKVTGDLRQVDVARQLIKEVMDEVGGVKECTSESYDFINHSFDIDRGCEFTDVKVAVIDSCREMETYCNRAELTFLSDPSGLVEYKAVPRMCEDCACKVKCESRDHHFSVGISAHGFFCAAILASRRISEAHLEEIYLGPIRGVSPPPRIALIGIGCPLCSGMIDEDMMLGIKQAIDIRADIISMSVAPILPAMFNAKTDDAYIFALLEAFKYDILAIVGAGNMGEHRLGSIAKFPPWCLTVASCTSKRIFKTTVEFGSEADYIFNSIEGSSINLISTKNWYRLRKIGEICNRSSVMYMGYDGAIIESVSNFNHDPSVTPIVNFTKEQSTRISEYLDITDQEGMDLAVYIHSSTKVEVVDSPLVSEFSSRGPCSYYNDFMKPDIIAPGEQIAAAWPLDVALGSSCPPYYAEYNVKSGTSFAVPQIAAAAAILRAELKFSASAIISALITTAKKMHGKEIIAYEYAYGAGMIDVQRAMRPGLVYEEKFFRYEDYNARYLAHFELNLPYFSASIPVGKKPWHCRFKRKVKNVELEKCTYNIIVEIRATTFDMKISEIQICATPTCLVFEEYGSEKEFTVSIAMPHSRVAKESFGLISGSLKLIHEDNEELLVDSPIIFSSKSIPPYHIVDQLYKT